MKTVRCGALTCVHGALTHAIDFEGNIPWSGYSTALYTRAMGRRPVSLYNDYINDLQLNQKPRNDVNGHSSQLTLSDETAVVALSTDVDAHINKMGPIISPFRARIHTKE